MTKLGHLNLDRNDIYDLRESYFRGKRGGTAKIHFKVIFNINKKADKKKKKTITRAKEFYSFVKS